jgi:NAD(P) transhydrogenase
MEQGRRALEHWLGRPVSASPTLLPTGVYTIPEMSSVGVTEAHARQVDARVIVGRAPFHRLARGQISAQPNGLLKLVVAGDGKTLLGVHVVGEGAAELVHLGQLAMLSKLPVDTFVDGLFNFPTLAEGYRVAALDVIRKRAAASSASAA